MAVPRRAGELVTMVFALDAIRLHPSSSQGHFESLRGGAWVVLFTFGVLYEQRDPDRLLFAFVGELSMERRHLLLGREG